MMVDTTAAASSSRYVPVARAREISHPRLASSAAIAERCAGVAIAIAEPPWSKLEARKSAADTASSSTQSKMWTICREHGEARPSKSGRPPTVPPHSRPARDGATCGHCWRTATCQTPLPGLIDTMRWMYPATRAVNAQRGPVTPSPCPTPTTGLHHAAADTAVAPRLASRSQSETRHTTDGRPPCRWPVNTVSSGSTRRPACSMGIGSPRAW